MSRKKPSPEILNFEDNMRSCIEALAQDLTWFDMVRHHYDHEYSETAQHHLDKGNNRLDKSRLENLGCSSLKVGLNLLSWATARLRRYRLNWCADRLRKNSSQRLPEALTLFRSVAPCRNLRVDLDWFRLHYFHSTRIADKSDRNSYNEAPA